MTLKPSEVDLLSKLHRQLSDGYASDELMLRYYEGRHRFAHIGLALPPQYRREYDIVTGGAETVVDAVVDRQQVKALVLPGEETADARLRAIMDGSNMESQMQMFNRDRRLYGRAFMSVATNERDEERPLIRVESPREMAGFIDQRHEVVTAAARFYGEDETTKRSPTFTTLYTPSETVWAGWSHISQRWLEIDRDTHRMGESPIFMHLNRRLSGSWRGSSAITPSVRSIIDGACRNLTNMQFAIESHGIPPIFMTGVARGDFIDKDGKPLPQWEAYYNAIHALSNPAAKIGQLEAADLTNFEKAQAVYIREMVQSTGFPASYFGVTTANPPAEGSIVGEEKRLTKRTRVESADVGITLGWAAAMAYWFATGVRVRGNQVRVEWHDPETPTIAQRMDAIVKAKQAGILSREGAWDALGYSEARKAKERAYFAAELNDPTIQLARDLMGGATDAAAGNV